MAYTAPVRDIAHTLNAIAGLPELIERGLGGDLDLDVVDAVLEEAGKFASEQLAPLNRTGDMEGARLENGSVVMPHGWQEVYDQWIEAGWGGLPCPAEAGGQGVPVTLSLAVGEMWQSACMAFSLNPMLTQVAVEALAMHGSEAMQEAYLPKLVTGEWSGTMQLTEPQAGSDLRFLKASAVAQPDGSYRLFGSKIFITYGEHDLAENIVHMVLARTPDAPEGTKGISLFAVPKYLVNADGSLGERNDFHCVSLEHKLGIHASPTCVMQMGDEGGAVGWLVGEEHHGLHHMFTMMNRARLGVGIQGVAIAERAYQRARAFAEERRQGGEEAHSVPEMVPIINHPDVRRMLLSMKAKTAAARAVCYVTAHAIDVAERAEDDGERRRGLAEAGLLTPVAKAFCTDLGVEVASEGIQVHGGMGYIEETGAAQHYRDARISPIYEGTNGIQAVDLVTRKLPFGGGETVRRHIADLRQTVTAVKGSNEPAFGATAARLEEAVDALEAATEWILESLPDSVEAVLAGATPYTRLFGLASGGVYLAIGALAEARGGDGGAEQIALARFFAENHAVEALGLAKVVTEGAGSVLDAPSLALSA